MKPNIYESIIFMLQNEEYLEMDPLSIDFKKSSFECWAANEILQAFSDCPFEDPEEILLRCSLKFKWYSCFGSSEQQFIFLTAANLADNILNLLQGEDINET